MRLLSRHPIRAFAVTTVLVLSLGGAVALTAPRAQRSALLAGLERPAQAVPAVVLGHAHGLTVQASPNRAGRATRSSYASARGGGTRA